MAVQKHNTYYDNELYYYDEHGVRKPLQVGKVYSAGSGIKIENDIISVSGKYVGSADPSLDGKSLVLKDNKWEELVLPPSSDWLPTIKEASANAVSTVEDKFGLDEYNQITSYNNTPFANDKYNAGYGLDLDSSTNTFSAKKGLFALSADVYNRVEVNELLSNFGGFEIVDVLPLTGDVKKIYLIKDESVPGEDQYKEYIFTNNDWVCIGDTSIDLTNYATSAWVIQNFLSANALDFMSGVSSQWNDVSSKLNTSDFNAWSAQADISAYSGIDPIKVEGHEISLTAKYLSADALDKIKDTSANWDSVYETVKATSGDWNEVSSLSSKADKLELDLDDLSGKVETLSGELKTTSAYLNEKIESLSSELESTSSFLSGAIDVVSAEFEKVVYTSATTNWDVIPYSAGKNINITNHTISSKDWTNEINEASANAVDVVKSKFNTTPDNKFSGYDNTPFYVKQNTVSGTLPIIVTKQGDEYNIEFEQEYKSFIEEVSAKLYTSALPTVSSLTPNYLTVELDENQDGTSVWKLSAAEQKNYQAGDYIDIDENNEISVTGLVSIYEYATYSGDWNDVSNSYKTNSGSFLTSEDLTSYSTIEHADNASANAFNQATALIPDVSNFITKDVNDLTNYYPKTQTSSDSELAEAFGSILKYDVTAAAGIEILTATDDGVKTFGISMTAQPVVTDTRLRGYSGIAAEPDGVISGVWDVGLTHDMLNTINGKLDTTVAAQTYQPKGDYVSSTDITDMATKTWVGNQGYLTQVPSDYVTDTELQTTLEGYATNTLVQNTSAAITALIPSTAGLASESDLQIVSAGVDYVSANAITAHKSLTNYYTKSETSGADELSAEFEKYALKSEIPTKVSDLTDSANYYKTTETSGATELSTEFAKYQTKGNYITSSDLVDSAKSATFAEYLTDGTDTSSFSEIKGSIDWCNTVADHYQTHSGEFVTSSISTITGTKQYALTSAGWVEVQAGSLSIPINVGTGNALNISTAESGTWGNNADGYLVIGHRSKAGNESFVFGNDSIAQNNSTVLNGGNSALHDSIAQGWKNIAIERSQAFGYNSSASNNSLAAGYSVVATDYSFAGGQAYNSTRGNILATDHSFALGVGSNNEPVIANKYSFAFGYAPSAQNFAFAFGKAIDVEGSDGHAVIGVGGYNVKIPSAAIIVGNGTNNARHNAFVVYNDGNVSAKNYKAEGYTDSNNNYVEASVPKSIPNTGDNSMKVQKMFVCTSDADIVAHAALANGEGCVFFRVG